MISPSWAWVGGKGVIFLSIEAVVFLAMLPIEDVETVFWFIQFTPPAGRARLPLNALQVTNERKWFRLVGPSLEVFDIKVCSNQ